jgi:hypothetical protein
MSAVGTAERLVTCRQPFRKLPLDGINGRICRCMHLHQDDLT